MVQEEEQISPLSATAVTNPQCPVAIDIYMCSEANLGRTSVESAYIRESLRRTNNGKG